MGRRIRVLLIAFAALVLSGCEGNGAATDGNSTATDGNGAAVDSAATDGNGTGFDSAAMDRNGAATDGEAWTAAAVLPQPAEQSSEEPVQPPKAAALTFDDGPHAGTTDRLLDGLRERGIHATFFLVGEEAAGNRDLVRRIAAEGHQVGNHTWSHRRLDSMEREEIVQEVGKTEALLESILGGGGYWVRPPYGVLREGTENLAAGIPPSAVVPPPGEAPLTTEAPSTGETPSTTAVPSTGEAPSTGVPLVRWSVDPRDWESRNREKIVSAVLDAVEPGSIVLLHDIYPASVEAALDIADTLKGQGYSLVTVAELLALYGRTPVPGEIVRSGTA